MLKRYVTLVLTVYLFSCLSGISSAQAPTPTVRLHFSTDDATSEYRARVEAALHSANATPEVVDNAEDAQVSITVNGTQDATITVRTTPMHATSPVLENHPDRSTAQVNVSTAEDAAALALYAAGACENAAPLLDDSSSPVMAFYRGNCAVINNNLEAAIDHYEAASTSGAGAYINRAWVYVQLARNDEAFASLRGMTLPFENASLVWVLSKRAELHALAFDYDRAIADVTAAIALDPQNAALYEQRARHIFLIYEWDRVLEDYSRAIELDPTFAEAYFGRGVLYYTQGPRENAIPDFKRYLDLAPDGQRAEAAAEYISEIEVQLDLLAEDE